MNKINAYIEQFFPLIKNIFVPAVLFALALVFFYAFENFSSADDMRGIILTTDGVINSFTSEDAYFRLIGNIFSAYAGTDAAGAKDELTAFLNEMSEKGSGDDLSVAVICRLK